MVKEKALKHHIVDIIAIFVTTYLLNFGTYPFISSLFEIEYLVNLKAVLVFCSNTSLDYEKGGI